MPTLIRIAVFPIKALDPVEVESTSIVEGGALAHDREYAMFDQHGRYINGKRNAKVHLLRSSFDAEFRVVTLRVEGTQEQHRFDLNRKHPELEAWLSLFFDQPVSVRRNAAGGYPDDTDASGPTLISTATLREIASWLPGLSAERLRRRFRANLEIDGVPAFWEDQLYSDRRHIVQFRLGEVLFEGVNPCQRCVVPTRDPFTGEVYRDFQKIFAQRRKATLPAWANPERFDHFYRLTVNTRIPHASWGRALRLGDEVHIVGERAADLAE